MLIKSNAQTTNIFQGTTASNDKLDTAANDNGKKQLVRSVIEKLKTVGVTTERVPWIALDGYWEKFPNGDASLGMSGRIGSSIESALGCLDECNLEKLLEYNFTSASDSLLGLDFEELWLMWKEEGLLEITPHLVSEDCVKLSCDAYLKLWQGTSFRVDCTSWGDWNPVIMSEDFEEGIKVIRCLRGYPTIQKAILISYCLEYMWNYPELKKMLNKHPGVLDKFLNNIGKKYSEWNLGTSVTVQDAIDSIMFLDSIPKDRRSTFYVGDSAEYLSAELVLSEHEVILHGTLCSRFDTNVQNTGIIGIRVPELSDEILSTLEEQSITTEQFYRYIWQHLGVLLLEIAGYRCGSSSYLSSEMAVCDEIDVYRYHPIMVSRRLVETQGQLFMRLNRMKWSELCIL